VQRALAELKTAAEAADAALPTIPSERAEAANRLILKVERALIPINYSRCEDTDHDPAIYHPVFPLMDDARKLAHMNPASDEYGFMRTRLVRSRNRVLQSLETATEALRDLAALAA